MRGRDRRARDCEELLEAVAPLVEGTSRDPVQAQQVCDAGSLVGRNGGEALESRSEIVPLGRIPREELASARAADDRVDLFQSREVVTCVSASEAIVLRCLTQTFARELAIVSSIQ